MNPSSPVDCGSTSIATPLENSAKPDCFAGFYPSAPQADRSMDDGGGSADTLDHADPAEDAASAPGMAGHGTQDVTYAPRLKKLNESAPPFIPMSHMMPPPKTVDASQMPQTATTAPMLEIEVMQLWGRLQAKTLEAQGLDKQVREKFTSLEQARRQILNLEQRLRNATQIHSTEQPDVKDIPAANPVRKGDIQEPPHSACGTDEFPTSPPHACPSKAQDKKDASDEACFTGPLPSKGSSLHHINQCKRCCFYPRGRCVSGVECNFCHFDHEKRKRKAKSKRSSLASSLGQTDASADSPQWDEVAKDILGMLHCVAEKGDDASPVNAGLIYDIMIGGEYEGKAADGTWWPCRISAGNPDGTFEASVHDAYSSKWSNVHRMNLRPLSHSAQPWPYRRI